MNNVKIKILCLLFVILFITTLYAQENILEKHNEGIFFLLLLFSLMVIYIFQMRKQNSFIDSLLSNMGDGVYGVDNDGICIWINQKALDIVGFRKDEVIGVHQHHLFHHHTIEHNDYLEKNCPIYKTTQDKQTRNCIEYFIKKDGTFFPVSLTVATADNYGAIVVFRDITDIKDYETKLEYEVSQKTEELQRLNLNLENRISEAIEENKKQQAMLEQQSRLAALGEMIGHIAHQWRQPLSVITTVISGIQLKQEFGTPITKELILHTSDTVIKQANYLSKTIDDFRDFIKNDSTQEIFNLSKVINDTVNLLDSTLKSNHIELFLMLDDVLEYNGQSSQLSQVLMNIVNNAKDAFKEKNQDCKQIILKTIQEGNLIKIEVIDNAGGINKDIKSKIFDPYFTTKHQSQGTGLGLYICVNIIEKYFNGKITIEDVDAIIKNNFYRGTKFIIEFKANLS